MGPKDSIQYMLPSSAGYIDGSGGEGVFGSWGVSVCVFVCLVYCCVVFGCLGVWVLGGGGGGGYFFFF
jgi:hypothetical protein